MRTQLDTLVAGALQQGSAVPAFTCYDFTTALAVVGAAEEAGRGAILLVSPSTAATPNGLRLIEALRGLADGARVPVAVQLDHASDLRVIADAVAAGADSVLVDGSSLDYEDNIALVRAARAALDVLAADGAGPEIVHITGTKAATYPVGEVALDYMFWPSRHVGLWLEPSYEVTFHDGTSHAIEATGGLIVGW